MIDARTVPARRPEFVSAPLVKGEGRTPKAIGVRFGCAASTTRGFEFAKRCLPA